MLTITFLDFTEDFNISSFFSAISENRLSEKGEGDIYRIVTFAWILFGLAYVSLIISYITEVFIKRTEQVEKITRDALQVISNRLSSLLLFAGYTIHTNP